MPSLMNGLFRTNGITQKLFFTSGSGTIYLPAGAYRIVLRGGGGAGGGNLSGAFGGTSGRGGRGQLTVQTIYLTTPKNLTYSIGDKGYTYVNGGNGGRCGLDDNGINHKSGYGGGGGKPTYVYVNNRYYFAKGGGGGGGAGSNGLFITPGGGGGGFYDFFSTGSMVAHNGAIGGSAADGGNVNGADGYIIGFQTLYGSNGSSGTGGSGGGAGGGAGKTAGAGAGGDLEAGGGSGGTNSTVNHGLWEGLTTTTENAQYGISGNYGSAGNGQHRISSDSPWIDATNGVAGCFLITRL